MDRQLYLDSFTDEYTYVRDPFSPPERYVFIYETSEDHIIERWTDGNKSVCIVYRADDYRTRFGDELRRYMLTEAKMKDGFSAHYLGSYTCPSDEYKKLCERVE